MKIAAKLVSDEVEEREYKELLICEWSLTYDEKSDDYVVSCESVSENYSYAFGLSSYEVWIDGVMVNPTYRHSYKSYEGLIKRLLTNEEINDSGIIGALTTETWLRYMNDD